MIHASDVRAQIELFFALHMIVLPIIIINAREAVRAVPSSLRQASYGLGATRWQTIWNHVLPSALPGILTGNISRHVPRDWRNCTARRHRGFDIHRR